jgi:hypothetical protein
MIKVPVENIIAPTHLSAMVRRNQSGMPEWATLDHYSGWIIPGFEGGGAPVAHETIKSFVMVNDHKLRLYTNHNDLLHWTVTAAIGSAHYKPDDDCLVAVDQASILFQLQSLPSVPGNPFCLVLRARIAAPHTNCYGSLIM